MSAYQKIATGFAIFNRRTHRIIWPLHQKDIILHPENAIMRGGAVVARWAHNPKVVGSSPAPATKEKSSIRWLLFLFLIGRIYTDPVCGWRRVASMPHIRRANRYFLLTPHSSPVGQEKSTGRAANIQRAAAWQDERAC